MLLKINHFVCVLERDRVAKCKQGLTKYLSTYALYKNHKIGKMYFLHYAL